jgi:Fumarylacetoacetate (FAA) hydrolase family
VDLRARGRAGPGHQGPGQERDAGELAERRLRLHGDDRRVRPWRGPATWKAGSWLGRSFDTFAPVGPCIATLDEIADPNDVHVQLWVDGQLRHNYNTDDMEHLVPELVEFASRIMTLNSGDIIACGTNHEGLGPLQDGEVVDFEIHGIGRMQLRVRDPLERRWDKGIYMGPDSTNPEAVQRNRPRAQA